MKSENPPSPQRNKTLAYNVGGGIKLKYIQDFIIQKNVKYALFFLISWQFPSHDDFTPGFYQIFWNMCDIEVFEVECSWLKTNVSLQIWTQKI